MQIELLNFLPTGVHHTQMVMHNNLPHYVVYVNTFMLGRIC